MKWVLVFLFILPCFATTPADLVPVFHQVATEYSVDYVLLSKIADIESGFDVNATTSTSTARGLFQVIRSTERWLRELCDITGDVFDPLTNARMGGCLVRHNSRYFTRKMGRTPNYTELYVLHFYGGYTGLRFIRLVEASEKPAFKGSNLAYKHFRRESRANPHIFFTKRGKARKLREVMDLFVEKMGNARVLEEK